MIRPAALLDEPLTSVIDFLFDSGSKSRF